MAVAARPTLWPVLRVAQGGRCCRPLACLLPRSTRASATSVKLLHLLTHLFSQILLHALQGWTAPRSSRRRLRPRALPPPPDTEAPVCMYMDGGYPLRVSCLGIHTHMCVYTWSSMQGVSNVCVYICMCLGLYLCTTRTHTHAHTHTHTHTHMHNIYVYIYTPHICIYIHTRISLVLSYTPLTHLHLYTYI